MVAFSGAKAKLTETPPWYTRWLYTHWTPSAPIYAAALKARTLLPLGISWRGERPRLYLTEEEKEEGRAILTELGLAGALSDVSPSAPGRSLRLVSVDATHRHQTRQWPAAHYAALMNAMAAARPEVRFLLPWGPGEEAHVRAIQAASSRPEHILVPDRMLSLRQLAACMAEASMHLGNCSAPRHMAVALDVPSFTFLGSTSTGWTFPSPEHVHARAADYMDMPCQPCNKNTCPLGDYRCLNRLTPELVLPAALAHLERFGR